MRPVCSKCEIELKCRKNGVFVIEYADADTRPYKIRGADEYECPACGIRIVTGFGQQPISEHFMDNFDGWLARAEQDPDTVRNYEHARAKQ